MARLQKGYVISDLHLLAARSDVARHEESLAVALEDADHLVLCGDIFDFRWSTQPSHAKSVTWAVSWLTDLARRHGACQFHYILGNHDCLAEFVAALETLARETPNLDWHPHCLRLGPHLFLHGDAVDAGAPGRLERYRDVFRHERQSPRWRHRIYGLVTALRLHCVVVRLRRRRRLPLLITRYLEHAASKDLTQATDVYFGHTHRPFTARTYAGRRFHNPGSTIRHLTWRIIPFEWEG